MKNETLISNFKVVLNFFCFKPNLFYSDVFGDFVAWVFKGVIEKFQVGKPSF